MFSKAWSFLIIIIIYVLLVADEFCATILYAGFLFSSWLLVFFFLLDVVTC